jgi:hypothetical protein
MLFRCTAAVRKLIGLNDRDLAEVPDDGDNPLEWYCNQIWIDRRKCIIFTHAMTLFSFVVPGVTKAEARDLLVLFNRGLLPNLMIQGYSREEIMAFPTSPSIRITKTRSRSILGSMKDIVNVCRACVEQYGGIMVSDFGDINGRLNQNRLSAIDHRMPADLMKSLLAATEASAGDVP